LAIGLSTLPAVAQTSANGATRGHVKDPTGTVLPETTITAVSSTAPAPFTVVSDREGYYRFLELPRGQVVTPVCREGAGTLNHDFLFDFQKGNSMERDNGDCTS
jgi:hypothetical protein